jgi:hypothetical protein
MKKGLNRPSIRLELVLADELAHTNDNFYKMLPTSAPLAISGNVLPPDTVVRFMRPIQGRRVAVGARGQLRGDRGRQLTGRMNFDRAAYNARLGWGCCQRRPKTGQWRSPRSESGERRMIH